MENLILPLVFLVFFYSVLLVALHWQEEPFTKLEKLIASVVIAAALSVIAAAFGLVIIGLAAAWKAIV